MWVICLILLWIIVIGVVVTSIFIGANSIKTTLVLLVRVTTWYIDLQLSRCLNIWDLFSNLLVSIIPILLISTIR